jgi:DnaJ domain
MNEHEMAYAISFFIVGFVVIYAIFVSVDKHQSPKSKESGPADADNVSGVEGYKQSAPNSAIFSERGIPWFEVLQVSEQAPFEVVRQAYRKQISQYHPDKIANMADELKELASLRSREINDAFNFAKIHIHKE